MKKILIEGVIGWDVQENQIRSQLEQAGNEEIEIEINSPGGFVYPGLTIYNLIRDYAKNKNKVIVKINGLAASMASYIAMAGTKIQANTNSIFMIHNVQSGIQGDYRAMQKEAKEIEALTNLIANVYSTKTGKSKKEIREMMDNETFLYGGETLEKGFIDDIIESETVEEKPTMIILAQGRVKDCFSKMKESDKIASDIRKAASLIDIAELTNQIVFEHIPEEVINISLPENPYPNEHAARIVEPEKFQQDSFRRKKLEGITGISIIIGKLKGKNTTTTQAYRFARSNWSAQEAKSWLKDHNIDYISFEAASGKLNKMEVKNKMDLNELKNTYPEIYQEVINLGVNQERERVMAHLSLGKESNAIDKAIDFISQGNLVTEQKVFAEYMKTGMKNQMKNARIEDNPGNINTSTNNQGEITDEDNKKDTEKLKKMWGVK